MVFLSIPRMSVVCAVVHKGVSIQRRVRVDVVTHSTCFVTVLVMFS